MIRVNLMENKKHSYQFCAAMNRHLRCRCDGCELACLFGAAREVERRCNEKKESIPSAVGRWIRSRLPHKPQGESILANCIGVDSIETVRAALKETA